MKQVDAYMHGLAPCHIVQGNATKTSVCFLSMRSFQRECAHASPTDAQDSKAHIWLHVVQGVAFLHNVITSKLGPPPECCQRPSHQQAFRLCAAPCSLEISCSSPRSKCKTEFQSRHHVAHANERSPSRALLPAALLHN